MVWLKLSADTLVHICMLLGLIFGVPPAILGATMLAWGNSMPDLANNLALARDGYPTMAITACFASPLFTLLVGTSSAMAYGAITTGGVLDVPFDRVLGLMYGERRLGSFLCTSNQGCLGVHALTGFDQPGVLTGLAPTAHVSHSPFLSYAHVHTTRRFCHRQPGEVLPPHPPVPQMGPRPRRRAHGACFLRSLHHRVLPHGDARDLI